MNNNDRFQIAMNKKDYRGAAELAISFGEGKASKSGMWAWARDAVDAAAKTGVTLDPGNLSWPDFETMRAALGRPA